jgi:uncharacterized membrane protein HdeD (DUF308 family)
MTTRDRTTLAACLFGLAVLALYTGAAKALTVAYVVGVLCVGAGVALLFHDPEDPHG